jgi:hypothetical protein
MLDERITQPNIKYLLPSYYQKEMKIVKNPIECGDIIVKFWEKLQKIN